MNDPESVNNSLSKPSDAEIVHRVIEGDINAFESLLVRYKGHVLEVVKKHVPYHEVEETAHDVFVRAYQSLPTFEERSSFKQWLSTIAVRACYDFWRKRYRSREVPMSSLAEEHHEWLEKVVSNRSGQSFADRDSQKKAGEVLDWALDRLSPEDRMVLELIYLEGLSGKEAADLLGWSVANVKIRSLRARRKLRNLLA
jgi:RNA polymerase sigma-70 factor (ECF subfamily)